jgi:hypothetical protein
VLFTVLFFKVGERMKVPRWMLFGLLISILIMDITSVWAVRGRIIYASNMALDAALVGGLIEYDAKRGKSYIDEDKAYEYAINYFQENMGLDSKLENQFLRKTTFSLKLEQDGVKPLATLKIKTTIKAMTPKLVGLEGIPIDIKKTQFYISKYK